MSAEIIGFHNAYIQGIVCGVNNRQFPSHLASNEAN